MEWKFNLRISGYILLLLAITAACTGRREVDARRVFRYNESKGIARLDPAFARTQTIIWPVSQLYNGLVEMNDSLQIVPSIAKSWKVSENGLEYRFILRTDVYFHDDSLFRDGKGRRVLASDFVYSFNRIISPSIASPGLWIFANVDTTNGKGFEAVSDSVFVIHLKSPFSSFLSFLTMPYCYVVPHEVVDYYGSDFRSHPVGTGPFMFKTWREGEKLIFVKNPNYFEKDRNGKRLPYLDAISITFITDKQSEFLEFMKGNLDFLSGVNAAYKDELITRSGYLNPKYQGRFQLITQPYLNTEYLGFMLDSTLLKSPYQRKALRKAINFGFDRSNMIKYLRNNLGTSAYNGFVPLGLPAFDKDLSMYRFNSDSARIYLARAGFPNGKGLPPISLTTTADYLDLAEFIQHELSEVGISMNIEISTGATFREMVANSKVEFFRASWIADYPDAENYLSLFYSHNFCPGGPNTTHFSNRQFDELYEKAILERNSDKRNELYKKMNRIVADEAPVVPLFYDKVVRLCPINITGFSSNAMNMLKLKYVVKK